MYRSIPTDVLQYWIRLLRANNDLRYCCVSNEIHKGVEAQSRATIMTDYLGCTAEPDSSGDAAPDDAEQIARCYSEAKRLGLKKYHGKPCRDCSSSVRYATSGTCVPCAPAAHREYLARNPEWSRRRSKAYVEANREKIKAYEAAMRERIRACDRQRPEGLIIARKDAIAQGFTTYYLEPCKHGHTSGRRHDGGCIECGKVYAQARGGRTDEQRARDAEAARERRAAKAAATAERRAAEAAERERVRAGRERAKATKAADRERARVARDAARPRHEPKRIAAPKLTDDERDAIARAQRTELARVEQERQRRLAAERADAIERARLEVEQKAAAAKAAGEPHKRLARVERELARAQVTTTRRATGAAASKSLSAEEQAAIDAALGTGKVNRIEQGTWDEHIERRAAAQSKPSPFRRW